MGRDMLMESMARMMARMDDRLLRIVYQFILHFQKMKKPGELSPGLFMF